MLMKARVPVLGSTVLTTNASSGTMSVTSLPYICPRLEGEGG